MSTRFKFIAIIAVIAAFSLLVTIFLDIKNTYLELNSIKTELSQVKEAFNQYQVLVQKVNEIDSKFTHELTHAKAENNKLYNNVINGLVGCSSTSIKQQNPPPPNWMMQKPANSLEKLDKIIIYSETTS